MRQYPFRVHPASPEPEPPQIAPGDDWASIAAWAQTIARAAYSHGYAAGLRNARGAFAEELRELELEIYVATLDQHTLKHHLTSDHADNRSSTGQ